MTTVVPGDFLDNDSAIRKDYCAGFCLVDGEIVLGGKLNMKTALVI